MEELAGGLCAVARVVASSSKSVSEAKRCVILPIHLYDVSEGVRFNAKTKKMSATFLPPTPNP